VPDIKLPKQEDFPEGLREHAKQADDGSGFVVNVVPKSKLDEFRTNNDDLKRKNEELTNKVTSYATVVGDDLEKVKSEVTDLRSIAQQVKDGKLKGSTEITAELERRTAEMKNGYETQLRALGEKLTTVTGERDKVRSDFDLSKVDQLITSAVLAEDSGVNPAALSDVLTRARGVYKVSKDGKVVAMNGDTVVYGSDGVTPLPAKEWLGKVIAEAPYLAKHNAGGGANGGSNTKDAGFGSPEFQKLPPAERIKRFRQAAKG
jgi:hypothetical protein